MLLSQLKDLRSTDDEDTGPRPYSRVRTVQWELSLDTNGRPRGDLVSLADPSDKATKFGRAMEVPNSTRTVGIAPNLGVDDVQYVLGWSDPRSKPDRVAKAHEAYVALCRRWAQEYPDDPAATALLRFYDENFNGGLTEPSKWSSKDLVVVNVAGQPVTDSETLWRLWTTVVEERKSGSGGGRTGLCVVCGTMKTLLDRMPQSLPKLLVPRAEQEVALISANKPIHGYDYHDGLATAQICISCGQATVANLARVLGDPHRTFSYDRQRTRMTWWITGNASSNTIQLLEAKPQVISAYLRSLATGRQPLPTGLDENTFCSVTVSGNVARLVVHDWIEMPLDQAERNVVAWLDDMKVTHAERAYSIRALVWCAGQWQPTPGDPGRGRYISLFDKAADRPDDLASLLLHAGLHHSGLPPAVLAHILLRIRTDRHLDTTRAALLRVALNRLPNRQTGRPTPMLDEDQGHPAYLCGRLFSVLQSLQYRAFPKADQPNTSFFDRYFAGAVANPRIALVQGAQMYPAWRKKLASNANRANAAGRLDEAAKDRAAIVAFDKRIQGIHHRLPAQSPKPLTRVEDQALFVLGYFHQRAHDFQQAQDGKAPEIIVDPALADDSNPLEGNGNEN